MIYDVIIVGGAAAGLTAGIYAARRALKTLIITKDIGGQALETETIENYPGYLKIPGPKLMENFQKQAVKSGAEVVFAGVTEVKEENEEFVVSADSNKYRSKAVILAFGKTPRSLNAEGENQFAGKGVSYCTICDLPLYKNKTVAIVGGGNSALEGTLYGSKIARKVYLIHRRDEFRGFEYLAGQIKKKKNVELVLNSSVEKINGDDRVKSVIVTDLKTNKTRELALDGIFIEIGSEVKTDFVKDLVGLDDKNHIVINNNCETYYPNSDKIRPGIFAAGDVTNTPFKQIIVSAGEGCKAALQAYNYVNGIKEAVFTMDWLHKKR